MQRMHWLRESSIAIALSESSKGRLRRDDVGFRGIMPTLNLVKRCRTMGRDRGTTTLRILILDWG